MFYEPKGAAGKVGEVLQAGYGTVLTLHGTAGGTLPIGEARQVQSFPSLHISSTLEVVAHPQPAGKNPMSMSLGRS